MREAVERDMTYGHERDTNSGDGVVRTDEFDRGEVNPSFFLYLIPKNDSENLSSRGDESNNRGYVEW